MLLATIQLAPFWPGGSTGPPFPPILIRALAVNQTVALAVPAGFADMIRKAETLNTAWLSASRKHLRWLGVTDWAAARRSPLPSAAQNERTACPAEAAWAVVSVPDTGGAVLLKKPPPALLMLLPKVTASLLAYAGVPGYADPPKTSPAGGGETRTGTPKS
jgi:hypothetical protein